MNLAPDSKVLIQGITEPLGAISAEKMQAYGTNIVAGVSPGQGGRNLHDIPVFDLVEQALATVGKVDTTILFVPPYLALDGAQEAIAAGIQQIILITEGIPPLDMVRLVRKAEAADTIMLGPGCSGAIVPGKTLLGTHPGDFYIPGPVGIVGRSRTLTHEVALALTQAKLGQSISINIGNSGILGSSFTQWLPQLDRDEGTQAIVLVGEVGRKGEEKAARYIASNIDKPVVAYIAGCYLPQNKYLGSTDTIYAQPYETLLRERLSTPSQSIDRVANLLEVFKVAKIPVADRPSQIPQLVKQMLI